MQGDNMSPPLPDVLGRRPLPGRPIGQMALAEHVTALDGPPLGEKRLLDELRELEPILRVLVPPAS